MEQADASRDSEKLTLYLDNNQALPLELAIITDNGQRKLAIRFDAREQTLGRSPNPRLVKNITDLLGIGQERVSPGHALRPSAVETGVYQTMLPLPDDKQPRIFNITLNNQPIAKFTVDDQTIAEDRTRNAFRALAVSETRMLAREMTPYQLSTLPYPRDELEKLDDNALPASELHTHLSAQLTGAEWSDIITNASKPVFYPLDMLGLIKAQTGSNFDLIDYVHDQAVTRDVSFKPAVDLNLPPLASELPIQPGDTHQCVDLRQLARSKDPNAQAFYKQFIAQLSIPVDSTIGPEEMDTKFYRFRNPLEKNKELQEAKILKIAENHSKKGIQYAEMSTSEVLNPDWLASATKAIVKAKARYPDTHIRLLAGIHRFKAPELIAQDIEKVKVAAHNPYVVGVDFMGYESNKPESINWAFHEMARWVRRSRVKYRAGEDAPFTDDFVIRIHAGETSKNANNVRHAIELAEQFGVDIRVGHLVRGEITSALKQKAKKHDIVMEFIPDSNIALQNADYPQDIPMKPWVESQFTCVVNSDGAGAYQTDPLQQAKTAVYAGLTVDQLRHMRQKETAYAQQRIDFLNEKEAAFVGKFSSSAAPYGSSFDEAMLSFTKHFGTEIAYLKPRPDAPRNDLPLPRRYQGKMPILLAGSSGTKWDNTPEKTKTQIRLAARMMTKLFDPHHVFFCTGRVKDRGVEKELDHALAADDEEHYKTRSGFDMVATYAGGYENLPIASGVNWVNKTVGSPEHVADNVVEFMEHKGRQTSRHDGEKSDGVKSYALFIGGGDFTREYIEETYKRALPFGMVLIDDTHRRNGRNPGATTFATTDKARYIPESHHIKQESPDKPLAQTIVQHMLQHVGIERLRDEHDYKKIARTDSAKLLKTIYEEAEKEEMRTTKDERSARRSAALDKWRNEPLSNATPPAR